MKIFVPILVAATLFTSCESSNSAGKCIGVLEQGEPGKTYELSVWNTVLGVMFFELIAPPVVVLAHETRCPVQGK